jgi:hypothetical protein
LKKNNFKNVIYIHNLGTLKKEYYFLHLSVMTDFNILELAKQGNVEAIATLINNQLQAKGIIAKVALKNACLQVIV